MSASPPVSVVIPAYNHERYAAAAIDSVLGQTFADFELVVVDDASRDATWDIVSAVRDPRLRAIRHATNQGAHASLNEAVAASRGSLVAVLNSDDIFHPRRIERLVTAARAAPGEPFLGFSDVDFIDGEGAQTPDSRRAGEYRRLCQACADVEPSLWFLAGNPVVSTSNLLFSRELFDAVGGFACLRYTHDWDWVARAAARCNPVWLHDALLSYRVHESNTLNEDDAWRHIHENCYVQASALLRLHADVAETAQAPAISAACRALLRNESLHPLSLLCFLVGHLDGGGSDALRNLATPVDGKWMLQSLADAVDYPADLFRSSPHLIGICRAIVEQAQIIEERWHTIQHMSSEIAGRDRWIEDLNARLASMQQSLGERESHISSLDRDLAAIRGRLAGVEDRLARADGELAALHASRVVRLAMSAGRLLRKLGVTKADPRLRDG
jgi:glycosyltransferase involved in cell wall biosynthesis